MAEVEQLRFGVEGGSEVSALLCRPANARWLLVLAHGAGAGMRRTHDFAGSGTGFAGWRARIGVLWFSAAPAQAVRNETSGPSCESYITDAVPARNAG